MEERVSKVQVGQIWGTNKYGKVEIIEKVRPCIFIGKFLESGYITKPSQAVAFYSGKITDFSVKNRVKSYYGDWKVLGECDKLIQPNGTTKRRLICECVCGEVRKVTLDTLSRGLSTNCGCLSREESEHFHGESYTRLYQCWLNMKARGKKRGTSCNYTPLWENYPPFKEWALENNYDDSKILLRGTAEFPDQGNYEPDNCRWGDKLENYLDWKRLKQNECYYPLRKNIMNKETKEYLRSLFVKHCNGRVPTSEESFWQADEFLMQSGVILDELCEALNLYEDEGK